MASLPDNAIALIAGDEIEKYQVVRIADEIVVDLLKTACRLAARVDGTRARAIGAPGFTTSLFFHAFGAVDVTGTGAGAGVGAGV